VLQPGRPHRELGELAAFAAAVAPAFPERTAFLAPQLIDLLSAHAAVMDSTLRTSLVKALHLLRNRGRVSAEALLPLWVSLLALPDKPLRASVVAHIVADVRRANAKARADVLNRAAQAALGGAAAGGGASAARACLSLLADLWRRRVWRDARTANALAGAVLHPEEGVSLAALKFFLGDDAAPTADSDDDGDTAAAVAAATAGPDKVALHKAHNLGTTASKKKKQKKLKRAVQSVKKAARREKADAGEGFAAIQLLHDPQVRVGCGVGWWREAGLQARLDHLHFSLARAAADPLSGVTTRNVAFLTTRPPRHETIPLSFYTRLLTGGGGGRRAPREKKKRGSTSDERRAGRPPPPPSLPHQTFAERLFARLRGGAASADDPASSARAPRARPYARADARLAAARVLSRVVGTHRLLLLNVYPWLQRQLSPQRADVHLYLAALVQAVHADVPPDALAPVLRQLVDGFVHDRARPEVAVAGLKAVAALCARAPLIMPADLLSDLALYRKARDKEVASAARGLVSLFREVAPGLLDKKDRGRASDAGVAPAAYGAAPVATRVPGADLLQAAEARAAAKGRTLEEEDEAGTSSDEEEGDGEEGGSDVDEEEAESGDEAASSDGAQSDADDSDAADADAPPAPAPKTPPTRKRAREAEPESLASLRKAVAAQKEAAGVDANPDPTATTLEPHLEAGRFLTDADFARIRVLRRQRLVETAMAKHGLKSASMRARAEAAAGEDADATLDAEAARAVAPETAVDPEALAGRARGRADKAARMASVLEGRVGREFGAAAKRHKKKVGGLSNREKAKKKNLPLAARSAVARRRRSAGRAPRGNARKKN
jgi:hypothetical protein